MKIKRFWVVSLIFAITLISGWFVKGRVLAHAEESLVSYNPIRTESIYSTNWIDIGLGLANPLSIPSIPFYKFSAFLNRQGFSPISIQQGIFFVLLVVPLISFPMLMKSIFPKLNNLTAYSAALFYVFNIYTITQVWNRFLYPQIFIWSYIPLFLLLVREWFVSGKLSSLLLIVLSLIVYYPIFSFVSSVFAIGIPTLLVTIMCFVETRFSIKSIWRSILLAFTIIIICLPWLWGSLSIKTTNYSDQLDSQKNLTAVLDVTQYFSKSDVLLLKQNYYFLKYPEWFSFSMKNGLLLSVLGIVVLGIVKSFNSPGGKLAIAMLTIGWFLSKGTNSPFGVNFYKFIFEHIPLTQILRNPYEKVGLVFLVAYSILFGIGVGFVGSRNRLIAIIIVFISCFVIAKPMWSGDVLKDYAVEVPQDYTVINKILEEEKGVRTLQMPFLMGAGSSYIWGYIGEEPSEYLFNSPSLSRTYFTNSDIYPKLNKYIKLPEFSRVFPILGVSNIVLHKDIIIGPAHSGDAVSSKIDIEKWNNVTLVRDLDNLALYSYKSDKKINWGYVVSSLVKVSSPEDGIDKVISGLIDTSTEAFATLDYKNVSKHIPDYELKKISSGHYVFKISDSISPYVLILSSSYNQNWVATINGESLNKHFVVNGFANGWIVDKQGSYNIDIIFKIWPWE